MSRMHNTPKSCNSVNTLRICVSKFQDHERFKQMSASDQFTPEERQHLSYLGSMLHQEPTEDEAEFQRIVEAIERAKAKGPQAQDKQITEEEASGS